jgi:hypothetical protein
MPCYRLGAKPLAWLRHGDDPALMWEVFGVCSVALQATISGPTDRDGDGFGHVKIPRLLSITRHDGADAFV